MNLYLRKVVHPQAHDNLYEALQVKSFFANYIFVGFFSFQDRLTRAQVCIDGTAAVLLGRDERSTPGARRVAPKARGVDGESARRATMVPGHYAANVTAFLLILFSPFRLVCSIDPRRSPYSLCSNSAASTYIRSESSPYQGPVRSKKSQQFH
jgi:hypothetical protein